MSADPTASGRQRTAHEPVPAVAATRAAAEATGAGRRIVIVGAGFSGTALAIRLLRDPPVGPCHLVLVEQSGRFGSGVAYSATNARALLNVPAGRMSVDESRPTDFVDYLESRGIPATPAEYVARSLYGEYLAARLADAAAAAPRHLGFERVTGTVRALARGQGRPGWRVDLADGRNLAADEAVLCLGNFPPRTPAALRPLLGSPVYGDDPWTWRSGPAIGDRVLLVGTGLTMADVACELAADPLRPREIVAVSRRGLLSRPRQEHLPECPLGSLDLDAIERSSTLREMTTRLRELVAGAQDAGLDWRDVFVALRERVPDLWRRLSAADRARFIRHLQPYWDVHRHQLPPRVGQTIQQLVAQGRLQIRAAAIMSAQVDGDGAAVGLRMRRSPGVAVERFDRVINCTGPEPSAQAVDSALVHSLLSAGLAVPDETGVGVQLDRQGRLVGRDGAVQRGLYYLGPWLRARDLEATAVHELRRHATALAGLLRSESALRARPG